MDRLAKVHSLADGQRDRIIMPIAGHTACSTTG